LRPGSSGSSYRPLQTQKSAARLPSHVQLPQTLAPIGPLWYDGDNLSIIRTVAMNQKTSPTPPPPPCPACGGSGQTSYFRGESRFLLSWDECPDCSGTGLLLDSAPDATTLFSSPKDDKR
jgi:hypothetical protein